MKHKKFILLLCWVLCLIGVLELAFAALTMSDTLFNVLGFILLTVFAYVSYQTNCFTNIKIKER